MSDTARIIVAITADMIGLLTAIVLFGFAIIQRLDAILAAIAKGEKP